MNSPMTDSLLQKAIMTFGLGALAASAMAQPCGWTSVGSGVARYGIWDLASIDIGGRPSLYIAGAINQPEGDPNVSGIIRWDGQTYSTLGLGTSGFSPDGVMSMTTLDAGGGAALYVGGSFMGIGGMSANRVAKWNGSAWSPLGNGVNSYVLAVAEFNGELYVGGHFTTAGGLPAAHIARWNGAAWSSLANGGLIADVNALAVYDDGGGAKLYVGGGFTRTADSAVQGFNHMACWDGASWSAVGPGLSYGQVDALTVFNGQLIAGGAFGELNSGRIAAWNGQFWSTLGGGVGTGGITALCVFDDGTGPALYAGGEFTMAGGNPANQIAKWDGGSWSPLGDGITSADQNGYRIIRAIAPFDDGRGPALYVGGYFASAGDVAGTGLIARWGCTASGACCRGDYNGDGDTGTDADIEAFFACIAGNCCPLCPPDADFNCDGDVGTDADIESFFRVLGGGPC